METTQAQVAALVASVALVLTLFGQTREAVGQVGKATASVVKVTGCGFKKAFTGKGCGEPVTPTPAPVPAPAPVQ